MHKLPVLAPSIDRIVWYATKEQAASMVRRGQALRQHRSIRLTVTDDAHPCRTFVARGGPLAAMGRSQDYTTRNERGRVDGFKRIFPEDWKYFHAATLGIVDL
jgi:hypothetical protein